MASVRDIRRRIKGVKATGKITRAMEMISAVKMRKAVSQVMAIRPYAESVIEMLHQLAVLQKFEQHLLLTERPVKKQLYVVISSNRGLCGGFNSQIIKKLRQTLKEDEGRESVFITIGKKADASVRRMNGEIIASFSDILGTPNVELMRPVAKIMIEEFEKGRIDRVVMIYTDFKSMLSQEVKVRALLPVTERDVHKALDEMGHADTVKERKLVAEYVIEPSPKKVLWRMIPRLIEMELYHAVLESNASQESARMMAMRNATDAAKEMVGDLTLAYNQIRQGKITQEIAELSAGMAAVQK
ncbi:MAG: ATP synthase F1 subunit gamma [Candidatus Moranbacteria bacterium]|jgi:F-type H+-transporting ATPase subunit gamma|nr:ATP synthase F1 subunit gamma [Candidatus Moranbacteria bacterium]